MLARAATPKVVTRQQDLRRFRLRLVQHEIGLGLALGIVTPIVKQLVAQAVLRNRLQESRRNDLVRIDIIDAKRHQPAFEWRELGH